MIRRSKKIFQNFSNFSIFICPRRSFWEFSIYQVPRTHQCPLKNDVIKASGGITVIKTWELPNQSLFFTAGRQSCKTRLKTLFANTVQHNQKTYHSIGKPRRLPIRRKGHQCANRRLFGPNHHRHSKRHQIFPSDRQ